MYGTEGKRNRRVKAAGIEGQLMPDDLMSNKVGRLKPTAIAFYARAESLLMRRIGVAGGELGSQLDPLLMARRL